MNNKDYKKEKDIRIKLKEDFVLYAKKCLKIRSKSGKILNFDLNKSQSYAHERIEHQRLTTGKVRAIFLKGRQQGMSTYVGGRFYHKVTHRKGVRAFILTHEAEATNNLFELTQRYHDNCPESVKPKTEYSSLKELYFGDLDSGYKVGTAGNKSVGRSSTNQYLHGSEVAFWPNADEHAKGIIQTVPSEKDTEIILESTANGVGNYFHEQWQLSESGDSEFISIFIPWFWEDNYISEVGDDFKIEEEEVELVKYYKLNPLQLSWRRRKIQELSVGGSNGLRSFQQEYPCCPSEAFSLSGEDSFISPDLVVSARKTRCENVGQLIIGVDPARFGDDRTSIIFRQGRKAFNLMSFTKKDTMEVVGIVYKLINDYNPSCVNIDVGGLGAGVVDRLIELGCDNIINGINAGSSALDIDRYSNKRAEMWGELRDWLNSKPCEIPDLDSLHADLCGIRYSFDSNSRIVMEPKDKMKKRGLRSPDEADALCLTFAIPIKSIQSKKNNAKLSDKDIFFKSKNLARLKSNRFG